MISTAERVINGTTYQVTGLPAEPGRRLLVRLMRIVGPSVGAALRQTTDGKVSLEGLTPAGLADAIVELSARVTEDDFEAMAKMFLDKTMVKNPANDGFMPLGPMEFVQNYGALFKLVAFHLEHNYSSFLDGLNLTKRPS